MTAGCGSSTMPATPSSPEARRHVNMVLKAVDGPAVK